MNSRPTRLSPKPLDATDLRKSGDRSLLVRFHGPGFAACEVRVIPDNSLPNTALLKHPPTLSRGLFQLSDIVS
jgi:hypothetical protein